MREFGAWSKAPSESTLGSNETAILFFFFCGGFANEMSLPDMLFHTICNTNINVYFLLQMPTKSNKFRRSPFPVMGTNVLMQDSLHRHRTKSVRLFIEFNEGCSGIASL